MKRFFPLIALIILSAPSILRGSEEKTLVQHELRQLNLHNKTGRKLFVSYQKMTCVAELANNGRAGYELGPDDHIKIELQGIDSGSLAFIDCRLPDYGSTTYTIKTKNKWNGCSKIPAGLIFALVQD